MKNKFNRYYFLNMQMFGTLLFVHMLMISVPLICWPSNAEFSLVLFFQICIILPLIPSLMYICLGCYWVFQKVIIYNDGIEIFWFKKCVKKVDWDVILSIEKTSHNKNQALKIELPNEEFIYLDNRKPIRRAIEFYSGKQIG